MADQIDVNELGRSVDPKSLSADELVDLLDAALSAVDASTVDPDVFARLVKRASKDQMRTVMASRARPKILDEVFRRMSQHYRADRATPRRNVVHWHITGAPGGGADGYQTVIENGTCTVGRELDEQPRSELTLGPVDFLKLVSGNESGPKMFITGKLKLSGDLGFAAGLTSMFDIPKA